MTNKEMFEQWAVSEGFDITPFYTSGDPESSFYDSWNRQYDDYATDAALDGWNTRHTEIDNLKTSLQKAEKLLSELESGIGFDDIEYAILEQIRHTLIHENY